MLCGGWGRIPRIFHQTAKSKNDLPKVWLECRETWLNQLSDKWEMHLWDDHDNDRFVRTRYPQYYQLYLDLPRPINRVDMVRYLYLHCWGGVYADLDTKCLKSIEPLLDMAGCSIVLGEHLSLAGRFVECAFMMSIPGHPFWIEVIEGIKSAIYSPTITQRLASNIPSMAVLTQTGPLLLSQVLQEYQRKNQSVSGIRIFPPQIFYPDPRKLPYPEASFVVHMFSGSWVGDSWEYRVFELQQTQFGRILIAVISAIIILSILVIITLASNKIINFIFTPKVQLISPT